MKKTLFFLSLFLTFLACSGDDDFRNNPNLVNMKFSFQIDLSLPQYDHLNFPGNSFVEHQEGINGIVIYNVNNSHYNAFEMSDPNHPLRDCSALELNGTEVTCGCNEGNVYNIATGLQVAGEGEYSLKSYRIQRFGNILEISN